MNIKNKPVIQMEEKDQIIYGLARERDLLRLENQYLREQIEKITKGKVTIPRL
jgi:kinesin family member 12